MTESTIGLLFVPVSRTVRRGFVVKKKSGPSTWGPEWLDVGTRVEGGG